MGGPVDLSTVPTVIGTGTAPSTASVILAGSLVGLTLLWLLVQGLYLRRQAEQQHASDGRPPTGIGAESSSSTTPAEADEGRPSSTTGSAGKSVGAPAGPSVIEQIKEAFRSGRVRHVPVADVLAVFYSVTTILFWLSLYFSGTETALAETPDDGGVTNSSAAVGRSLVGDHQAAWRGFEAEAALPPGTPVPKNTQKFARMLVDITHAPIFYTNVGLLGFVVLMIAVGQFGLKFDKTQDSGIAKTEAFRMAVTIFCPSCFIFFLDLIRALVYRCTPIDGMPICEEADQEWRLLVQAAVTLTQSLSAYQLWLRAASYNRSIGRAALATVSLIFYGLTVCIFNARVISTSPVGINIGFFYIAMLKAILTEIWVFQFLRVGVENIIHCLQHEVEHGDALRTKRRRKRARKNALMAAAVAAGNGSLVSNGSALALNPNASVTDAADVHRHGAHGDDESSEDEEEAAIEDAVLMDRVLPEDLHEQISAAIAVVSQQRSLTFSSDGAGSDKLSPQESHSDPAKTQHHHHHELTAEVMTALSTVLPPLAANASIGNASNTTQPARRADESPSPAVGGGPRTAFPSPAGHVLMTAPSGTVPPLPQRGPRINRKQQSGAIEYVCVVAYALAVEFTALVINHATSPLPGVIDYHSDLVRAFEAFHVVSSLAVLGYVGYRMKTAKKFKAIRADRYASAIVMNAFTWVIVIALSVLESEGDLEHWPVVLVNLTRFLMIIAVFMMRPRYGRIGRNIWLVVSMTVFLWIALAVAVQLVSESYSPTHSNAAVLRAVFTESLMFEILSLCIDRFYTAGEEEALRTRLYGSGDADAGVVAVDPVAVVVKRWFVSVAPAAFALVSIACRLILFGGAFGDHTDDGSNFLAPRITDSAVVVAGIVQIAAAVAFSVAAVKCAGTTGRSEATSFVAAALFLVLSVICSFVGVVFAKPVTVGNVLAALLQPLSDMMLVIGSIAVWSAQPGKCPHGGTNLEFGERLQRSVSLAAQFGVLVVHCVLGVDSVHRLERLGGLELFHLLRWLMTGFALYEAFLYATFSTTPPEPAPEVADRRRNLRLGLYYLVGFTLILPPIVGPVWREFGGSQGDLRPSVHPFSFTATCVELALYVGALVVYVVQTMRDESRRDGPGFIAEIAGEGYRVHVAGSVFVLVAFIGLDLYIEVFENEGDGALAVASSAWRILGFCDNAARAVLQILFFLHFIPHRMQQVRKRGLMTAGMYLVCTTRLITYSLQIVGSDASAAYTELVMALALVDTLLTLHVRAIGCAQYPTPAPQLHAAMPSDSDTPGISHPLLRRAPPEQQAERSGAIAAGHDNDDDAPFASTGPADPFRYAQSTAHLQVPVPPTTDSSGNQGDEEMTSMRRLAHRRESDAFGLTIDSRFGESGESPATPPNAQSTRPVEAPFPADTASKEQKREPAAAKPMSSEAQDSASPSAANAVQRRPSDADYKADSSTGKSQPIDEPQSLVTVNQNDI